MLKNDYNALCGATTSFVCDPVSATKPSVKFSWKSA